MSRSLKKLLLYGWPLLLLGALGVYYSLSPSNSEGGAGSKLYQKHCAGCHMEQGQGLRKLIPALAGSELVLNSTGPQLACMIRNGIEAQPGVAYPGGMTGNELLSAAEIRTLINYMRTSWGNNASKVPFQEIQDALDNCTRK